MIKGRYHCYLIERPFYRKRFIFDGVKSEIFFTYLDLIDESKKSFESRKRILDLSEFINFELRSILPIS